VAPGPEFESGKIDLAELPWRLPEMSGFDLGNFEFDFLVAWSLLWTS
jgi:hypothetical protein